MLFPLLNAVWNPRLWWFLSDLAPFHLLSLTQIWHLLSLVQIWHLSPVAGKIISLARCHRPPCPSLSKCLVAFGFGRFLSIVPYMVISWLREIISIARCHNRPPCQPLYWPRLLPSIENSSRIIEHRNGIGWKTLHTASNVSDKRVSTAFWRWDFWWWPGPWQGPSMGIL